MPPDYLWQAWSGQGHPMTVSQEIVFVSELQKLTETLKPATRSATTNVLNALRVGLPAPELVRLVPGVDPGELLASYLLLAEKLEEARAAWFKVASTPTAATIAESTEQITKLLPIPMQHIVHNMSYLSEPTKIHQCISVEQEKVAHVNFQASQLEAALENNINDTMRARKIGVMLYSGPSGGGGLWAHPYFLANRVSALTPPRAMDLRGDPRV